MKILAINPGSTSTKIALFENESNIFTENINHETEHLNTFENLISQKDFRLEEVKRILSKHNYTVDDIDAFVGRGGLLKPIKSGTYEINEPMLKHLEIGISGEHASNLGGIIASQLASVNNVHKFIVDPVVVDELQPIARITGIKDIKRTSIFHALNQKSVAKKFASENNMKYEDINVIVAHLGGGISVGVHEKGRVVDVNNAIGGDGPFSPERAGSLHAVEFFKYIQNKSTEEVKLAIKGNGGLVNYFGTNDCREVVKLKDNGNEEAKIVLEAMCYNIAKEIGSMATVVSGKIDAIILTGGIAYSDYITSQIIERVKFIAPVSVYAGENEMEALALGALRVLKNEEKPLQYNF